MTKPNTVSLAVLANFLNIDERRVQQLAKAGVIPQPETRGEYDFLSSVKGYIVFLQDEKRGGTAGSAEMKQAKEREAKSKADMLEMRAARMREDLVWAEDVRAALCNAIALFKSRMRAIPSEIAPEVRMQRSDGQAQKIIQKSIDTALGELSNAIVSVTPGTQGDTQPPDAV